MRVETQEILDRALQLPAVDRACLVDEFLTSLDKPDEAVDAVWRQEVEARLKAYHAGNLRAVSLAQVVAKYRK